MSKEKSRIEGLGITADSGDKAKRQRNEFAVKLRNDQRNEILNEKRRKGANSG